MEQISELTAYDLSPNSTIGDGINIYLNVGLGNNMYDEPNPFRGDKLLNTIVDIFEAGIIDLAYQDGYWVNDEGTTVKEETLVVILRTEGLSESAVERLASKGTRELVEVTMQDAIPYMLFDDARMQGLYGELVWNSNVPKGEQYGFDMKYFQLINGYSIKAP